jgi:hypothetical protein
MASVYIKGSKTKYASRKSKTYGEGRTCSEIGCEVSLSKYNERTECFVHHKFKQPRVRGRENALEKFKDERDS